MNIKGRLLFALCLVSLLVSFNVNAQEDGFGDESPEEGSEFPPLDPYGGMPDPYGYGGDSYGGAGGKCCHRFLCTARKHFQLF